MSYVGATPGTGWYFLAAEEGAQPERVVCFVSSDSVTAPVIRDPNNFVITKTMWPGVGTGGQLVHESEL